MPSLKNRWFAGVLIFGLLLGAAACGGSGAKTNSQASLPIPSPRTTLTAPEEAQLAQLESRPLKLPAMPADGTCPDGPHTPSIVPYPNGYQEKDVYGLGPVYGYGGHETRAAQNNYFDVTYFTDPTVTGVVLVRLQDLAGYKGVFTGPYATGPVVGTDTISGVQTELRGELALPVASPPPNTGAAPGWGIWAVRQGIDKNAKCAGLQIDTGSSSQVIVAAPR